MAQADDTPPRPLRRRRRVSGSLVQDDIVSADIHGIQTALDSIETLATPRVSESERGRKAFAFLDNLRFGLEQAVTELDDAATAHEEAETLRDDNTDPAAESTLNRRILESTQRLSRAKRDYDERMDEVEELREASFLIRHHRTYPEPALPEQPMAAHAPPSTTGEGGEDTIDELRDRLEANEALFAHLEAERASLILKSNTVDTLAEHVAYVEHLNDALMETLLARQNQIAELNAYLGNARVQQQQFVLVIGDLNASVDELRTENEGLRERTEFLGEQARTLVGVANGLRAEREELRGEIDELKNVAIPDGGIPADGALENIAGGEEGGVVVPKLEESTEMMDQKLVASLPSPTLSMKATAM